ncbi:MAG: DNA alkylation repair protein [Bacteroidetes bacterium]|nr:DNA alkylation repair protein [Bacteroidota bacterium]
MFHTGILIESLRQSANAETARPMEAYMKNRFPFLGIKKPERAALMKPFLKEARETELDLIHRAVDHLWTLPEREFHYTAMGLMDQKKKFWNTESFALMESLITRKSWWDSVDHIATNQLGAYLLRQTPEFRRKTALRWSADDNMWLNRTALIFQLKYKEQTDVELLFSLAETHSQSKEFFIRKAIGWALRQYAYTAPEDVRAFLQCTSLHTLSVREASKHL